MANTFVNSLASFAGVNSGKQATTTPPASSVVSPTPGGSDIYGGNTLVGSTNPNTPTSTQSVVSATDAIDNTNKIKANADQVSADMVNQSAVKSGTASFNPNVSVVDYLNSTGQASDFASRSALAESKGITNYTGSPEQNTQLLATLKNTPAKTETTGKTPEQLAKEVAGAVGGTEVTPAEDPKWQDTKYSGVNYNGITPTEGNKVQYDQYGNVQEVPMTDVEKYISQLNANTNKIDLAYTDYTNKMDKFTSGTFPLTSDQQAQVDAIKSEIQGLKDEQILANKNYEMAIRKAGIAGGRNIYAPDIQAGNIKGAIDEGLKKIADLDAKGAAAIAQLKSAFNSENYKMVNDAWTSFNSYMSEKSKTLTDTYTAIRDAMKDERDFSYQKGKDLLNFQLESNKFTWQQKQDLITNAINEKKLSIDEAKVAQDNLSTSFLAALSAIPAAQLNADGSNNELTQKVWLQQFDPQLQTLIKGIADYTINPNDAPSRVSKLMGGKLDKQTLVSLAQRYDPTYSDLEWQSRQKFLNSWRAGGVASVVYAANTSIKHINELNTVLTEIANSNDKGILSKQYNNLSQFLQANKGNSKVGEFKQIVVSLQGELAKIYKNGINSSASPDEAEQWAQGQLMNLSWGKEGLQGILGATLNLMGARIQNAREFYQMNMGKSPDSIILPSTKSALDTLKSNGVTFNAEIYDPEKADPLQSYYSDNPDIQPKIEQMINDNPGLNSESIYQILFQ